jgi:ABC-type nitrate/sulfonate/bicarbonate transport system substrate-binding protein
MSQVALDIGFVPLLDAAPLVIARELGFAAEEGLELRLHREPSWSALRDRLLWGSLQAAHMLAPMPVALTAGIGGVRAAVDALLVLSVNGDMIGVRPELAARMGASELDFLDASAVGRALVAAGGALRIGVPFPVSMHVELLHYWLGGLGEGPGFELRTVPPPRMAEAVSRGEIDAFCVGEPWGSVAAEAGAAELVLPGAAIWRFAPEKVLAALHDWTEANPELVAALMRAVWRAGRWLAEPGNVVTATELMGQAAWLDVAPEILERPLRGRLVINARGEERRVAAAIEFFRGAATFPWRSQALWIAESMARRTGADREGLRAAARASFRPDLYRAALGPAGADLPGASEKLEGALPHRTEVASTLGTLLLGPDAFHDGQIFDPR